MKLLISYYISLAAVSVLCLGTAPEANATPIQYSLNNFVFDDGSHATGTFSFDESICTIANNCDASRSYSSKIP